MNIVDLVFAHVDAHWAADLTGAPATDVIAAPRRRPDHARIRRIADMPAARSSRVGIEIYAPLARLGAEHAFSRRRPADIPKADK